MLAVPKPAATNGKPIVGVGFPHTCQAQWLAVSDFSRNRVWLFTIEKARELAQQPNSKGLRQLYWHIESTERKGVPYAESDVDPYRVHIVAAELRAAGSAAPTDEDD